MLASTENIATLAADWLADFERALATGDERALEELFDSESHWRDVLALTWRIGTLSGAHGLAAELLSHAAWAKPHGFEVDLRRTAPREVTRAGGKCIEAIFRFETAIGRGNGVLRLLPSAKAWTLLTALDE